MVLLRGEKIILKALERDTCKKLWDEYEPTGPLPTEQLNPGMSRENADKWFEDIQSNQGKSQYYLGIFTLDGQVVGDIQLSNINWRYRTAELGFGIAGENNRGKGYAIDATRTIINFAFNHLDIYRITARTAEFNEAAKRLMERVNFKLEGRERKSIFCEGKRWDKVTYGLLKEEWSNSK